jgi:hypothetical protein
MNAALRINPVTARICEQSGPSNLILFCPINCPAVWMNSKRRVKLNCLRPRLALMAILPNITGLVLALGTRYEGLAYR